MIIFVGSVPLFKTVNSVERYADQLIVCDTRLPFVKFPRNPNL